VTQRRDREWLIRYMKEPDKMLEERDPVAVALYHAYKSVRMPNLRLSDMDVQKLMNYIEEESHRVEHGSHHHK
jgi:protein SCO1/2